MILLTVQHDGTNIRKYQLDEGTHAVGSQGVSITLQYPTVSKHHGEITVSKTGVTYRDVGSRNGSFLNKKHTPLARFEHENWAKGDLLFIGPFTLQWSSHISPTLEHTPKNEWQNTVQEYCALYFRLLNEKPQHAHEALALAAERIEDPDTRSRVIETIHYEFHGQGPLRGYISDPSCREIIVNAHNEIFVDLGAGLVRLNETFVSNSTYEAWAIRTAHQAGRRLDLQHPVCEATLENGARFHAVMSPVSARGLSVAIRRFGSAPVTETSALNTGWVDATALATMKQAVTHKLNIVVSGGTSTGKTSLLNFLCQYLPRHERILTVEDTVELAPPVDNLVQLQARKANADGIGEISLRQLVQCALRMRPDRIIVGECRGAEVIEMLQALNTGHPGSLTTVHANSTDEALHRLELLALLGATNLSIECIREWIRTTIDLIVQVERDALGHRHVAAIAKRTGATFENVYVRPNT